jgi:hypothetical protein
MDLPVPHPRQGVDLWIPRRLLRRSLAELADPFAPLWDIWLGGYALSYIGPDAVVLEATRL